MKGKDIEENRNTPQKILVKKKVKDIKNKKYLYAIYRAMNELGKTHGAVIIRMSGKDSYQVDINERNYIIFLSYTLGKIQGRFKDKIICKNDYVNGEIFKKIQSSADECIKKAYNSFEKILIEKKGNKGGGNGRNEDKDYVNVRPDFVIHQSQQLNGDDKGQKLIIEAKATKDIDETDFYWDILKLNYYIQHYCFRNAIYLIVNSKIDNLENQLQDYNSHIKYYCTDINKLWFFVQNCNGKKLLPVEIYQLKNNLKDKCLEAITEAVYTED